EEQCPVEVLYQGVDKSENVDDGQLSEGVPADKHEGKDQIAMAQMAEKARVLGKLVLHKQNHGEQQQGDTDHGDLPALLIPDVQPDGALRFFDGGKFLCAGRGALYVAFRCLVA